MKKLLAVAVLAAFPLAAQATGYYAPRVIEVTKTITVEKPIYVNNHSGVGWPAYVAWGLVVANFGNAIWTHAACVAAEDKAKVPDNKRKCYKHKPVAW